MWLITYLFYVRKKLKTFENSKYAYRIFNFGFNTFIETIPFRKWCFEKYLWKLMLTKFCKRSMLAEFIWIWNNENKKLKRNQKIRIDRISKRRLPTKIVCKNKWKFKKSSQKQRHHSERNDAFPNRKSTGYGSWVDG